MSILISTPSRAKSSLRDLNLAKKLHGQILLIFQYFANFCGTRFVGRGLFSIVDPKEHRERRLFLNPAFHKTALVSLMNQFNGSTTALIHKLKEMCLTSADGSVEVNIADLLAKTTLDVIAKVAFGLDLNSGKFWFWECTDRASPNW